jgi:hypothetical protein
MGYPRLNIGKEYNMHSTDLKQVKNEMNELLGQKPDMLSGSSTGVRQAMVAMNKNGWTIMPTNVVDKSAAAPCLTPNETLKSLNEAVASKWQEPKVVDAFFNTLDKAGYSVLSLTTMAYLTLEEREKNDAE